MIYLIAINILTLIFFAGAQILSGDSYDWN